MTQVVPAGAALVRVAMVTTRTGSHTREAIGFDGWVLESRLGGPGEADDVDESDFGWFHVLTGPLTEAVAWLSDPALPPLGRAIRPPIERVLPDPPPPIEFHVAATTARPVLVALAGELLPFPNSATAARLAAETLTAPPEPIDPTGSGAIKAFAEAHRRIRARRNNLACSATLVAIYPGPSVVVAHLGDGRLYRRTRSYLAPLTIDHHATGSTRVTRHLGGEVDNYAPDVRSFPAAAGDRLILCGRGVLDRVDLSTSVGPQQPTPESAARSIAAAAMAVAAQQTGSAGASTVSVAVIDLL